MAGRQGKTYSTSLAPRNVSVNTPIGYHLMLCIGYFSAAVMKHHDQGNLRREELSWTSGSKTVRGRHAWEPRQQAPGRHGGRSRTLRGHIFKDKHKVERANWMLHKAFSLKAYLSLVTYFLSKAAPCKPPQTATNWELSVQPPKGQGEHLSLKPRHPISTQRRMHSDIIIGENKKSKLFHHSGIACWQSPHEGAKQLLYD